MYRKKNVLSCEWNCVRTRAAAICFFHLFFFIILFCQEVMQSLRPDFIMRAPRVGGPRANLPSRIPKEQPTLRLFVCGLSEDDESDDNDHDEHDDCEHDECDGVSENSDSHTAADFSDAGSDIDEPDQDVVEEEALQPTSTASIPPKAPKSTVPESKIVLPSAPKMQAETKLRCFWPNCRNEVEEWSKSQFYCIGCRSQHTVKCSTQGCQVPCYLRPTQVGFHSFCAHCRLNQKKQNTK